MDVDSEGRESETERETEREKERKGSFYFSYHPPPCNSCPLYLSK